MEVCDCNASIGNTGMPNCVPIWDLVKQWIDVPTFDSTGVKNKLTLAGLTFDQAFLDDLINEPDASKRWYPQPFAENATNERAETVYETANSGRKRRIKQGIRTMQHELWDGSPELLGQLQKQYCTWTSRYGIDVNGNLIGMLSSDGLYLLPIRMDKNSSDYGWVFATDTTGSKISVITDWYETEQDKNLKMLSANDITADLLGVVGLIDVIAVLSSISTTGFHIALKTKQGTVLDPIMVQGIVTGDSILYNINDAATVTKLTWVEASPGNYTTTFAAQGTGEVLRLTITKAGYDFSVVTATPITIP